MDLLKTKKRIQRDEAFRQFPYSDATGLPVKAPVGNITIGYGWNIQGIGITEKIADYVLELQINEAFDNLKIKLPFFNDLSDVRQQVLINMAFNMGLDDLMKFKNTLSLLKDKKYPETSIEMLDSDAARKLKERYARLSKEMLTNEWVFA